MGAAASQMSGLRRVMKGTEYFTLAFGSIVGVGWMVVIEEWLICRWSARGHPRLPGGWPGTGAGHPGVRPVGPTNPRGSQ